jgi:hypothetical protein
MALTHTDTGAHPRQSGFRPRRSPAPPLDPLKANIHSFSSVGWEGWGLSGRPLVRDAMPSSSTMFFASKMLMARGRRWR